VQAVREEFYPSGDFHRVYFGEIVAAYADENAGTRLSTRQEGAGKSLR
jgi:flavin reductase (DIM6/NTAB) family NADH-FMN oxidoreductase RutF